MKIFLATKHTNGHRFRETDPSSFLVSIRVSRGQKFFFLFLLVSVLLLQPLRVARAQVVTTAVLQISAEVVEGTGTYLEVSPTNYTFSVNPFFPTPTDHRVDFNSGTATYFVANGPWSIEVVSDNTNNVDGLATSSGDVLSMKFNTPNLGASDSESDTNWVGDTATFRPVVDNDNLAPLHLADSAGDDRSPTPFTFAADALGGVATNYKSIIEFRLVIE